MNPQTPSADDRSLRSLLLGLKGALYDANTQLYAFPFHFDALQRLVECCPTLGVLYLEVSDFSRVEWLCGWQTFDEILGSLARELERVRGESYPASALLSSAGVHGGGFLLFL